MSLKPSKVHLLCLILLLNVNAFFAFNYKFSNYKYEDDFSLYTCEITPDIEHKNEIHLSDKTDDDVIGVVVDGIIHLNSSEYSFCERFKNIERIKTFKVKSIYENLFQKCEGLTSIRMNNGHLNDLPENLFSTNTKLALIELSNNNLKELNGNIFKNLKNLSALTISSNELLHLPSKIFNNLENLHILSIQSNGFKSLNPEWFENLKNLGILNLNFNKISDLPKNVFNPLENLQHLWLWANELTVIHSDSFGIHPKLQNIDLKQNKISQINKILFDKVAVSNLDMEISNFCFRSKITSKSDMRKKLKKCFENYVPRKESNLTCGTHKIGKESILGGTQIERGSYPWNAALVTAEGKYVCGGTLVSNKTIVTAAHCFIDNAANINHESPDINVILGGHNLDITEMNRISASVKSINIHSDWNQKESSYDADIAVLELTEEIQFDDFIQPICLIESDAENFDNLPGKIIGFNKIDDLDSGMTSKVYIIKHQTCSTNKDLESILGSRTFCGVYENGTGSCKGDIGSGLIVFKDGNFYLRGIVSTSQRNIQNDCKRAEHVILTDVSKFTSFVKSDGHDVFGDKLRLLNEENEKLKDQVRNLQEALNNKNKNWLCKFA
ncbi:unnamed protein product [Chironomus riparius]|uniref:Peptidase S1 domain-containing protein n=1 Tax=Chironomus riparius TaxID=315576 RepID=A0A9P0JBW6_9DIPT|nr:unnamed protein product [Chironomus riparius]